MSFGPLTNRLASQKNISSKQNTVNSVLPNSEPVIDWVRPADWLTLPTLTNTDNKFVGLHAIHPESNFISLRASGNYTVDWGDGVIENYASNVQCYHEYDYNTYDVTNTTLSSRGYKQVIVQVYPQAGQTFSALNLHLKHNKSGLGAYSSGFLDISVAGSVLTSLFLGSTTNTAATKLINFSKLEQVKIYANSVANMSYLLNGCSNLMSVPVLNLNNTTNISFMFANCFALKKIIADFSTATGLGIVSSAFNQCRSLIYADLKIPYASQLNNLFDSCSSLVTAKITTGTPASNFSYMFYNCTILYEVVISGPNTVTNTGFMFYNCTSMIKAPLFNTASTTVFSYMFYNCYSLTSVPLYNTINVTQMDYIFQNCYSLPTIPLWNTQNVTNMSGMFGSCYTLTSAPLLNTIKVVNFSSMFAACYSLTTVPLLNTIASNNMTNMFQACYSLTSVPLFNTANVTSMPNMFSGCYLLASVPLFNTAKVTNMSAMFQLCYKLTTVPLFNTSKVINMTSMFNSCYSLTSVPLFDTSRVENMSTMFSSCSALTSVPLFDTGNVTNMTSMFNGCTSLTSVPLFNMANATTTTTMFQSCTALTTLPAFDFYKSTTSVVFSGCTELSKLPLKNINIGLNASSLKLSVNSCNEITKNLYASTVNKTLTLTGNHGVSLAFSRPGQSTMNSNVISCLNTSGLTVGLGIPYAGATKSSIALYCSTGQVNIGAHGLAENTPICFLTDCSYASISRTLPASGYQDVAYGNNIWVAVSNANARGATSTDSTTWTLTTLPVAALGSIAFGNGIFVAIATTANINTAYVSTDGINWTSKTLPVTGTWNRVRFVNGKFVIISKANLDKIVYSTDGNTWNQSTIGAGSRDWADVTYGDGKWVVIAYNSNAVAYSTDLINWSSTITPIAQFWSAISYGNGIFVAISGRDQSSLTSVTSTDGINWTQRNLPSSTTWNSIAFGDGVFVATSTAQTTTVISSTDGVWWFPRTIPSLGLSGIAHGNNRFVSTSSITANALVHGVTGIDMTKVYYTKNVSANDFQISETSGGVAKTLTSGAQISSVQFRVGLYITAINPNVNITVSGPAASSFNGTMWWYGNANPALAVDPQLPLMKNFNVSY